ncbi:MAG TPA: PAC2 family protein [Tepidisphaeraceae bacterium]|jgi:predicted ATP-grasp superfamily ATP-dependent carboligase
MALEQLQQIAHPKIEGGTMLLALAGWMDGGHVSTGTVGRMMEGRSAAEFARINSDPFYIYNFPGSMEIAALFRPPVKLENGLIRELEMPVNVFHCDEAGKLAFFIGREPNLRWQEFADCIFAVVKEIGVSRIIFMGSFGGGVPHTREPHMYASISHPSLRAFLRGHNLRFSDYQGPSSFSTLLLAQSADRGVEMISLVAEIPSYLQGLNPLSIEAVTRRLARILNEPVDFDALRAASNAWEIQVSEAVERDQDLAATVRRLEEEYDNELIGKGAPE